jgi:enolase
MTRDTRITRVSGRRIWTPLGTLALEVDIQLACGAQGRAVSAPALGMQVSRAAVSWRLAPPATASHHEPTSTTESASASAALDAINGAFASALRGVDAMRQQELDATLVELDAGGNPSLTRALRSACSIAAAQAAANAVGLPLFRYLHAGQPTRMPMPVVDVAAAAAANSPFRALALVPFIADGVDDALGVAMSVHSTMLELAGEVPSIVDERTLDLAMRAIERSGFVPAEEIGLALDVGAARLYREGKYHCAENAIDAGRWQERLVKIVEAYPLSAIEDPLADVAALLQLAPLIDHRARVVGDDLFASDAERIAAAVGSQVASAVTLRPEAAGTLTELRLAFNTAQHAAWPVLAAAEMAGEDVSLIHIATAWQASYVKLGSIGNGSFTRGNELLRIEAMLQRAPEAARVEAAARLVH